MRVLCDERRGKEGAKILILFPGLFSCQDWMAESSPGNVIMTDNLKDVRQGRKGQSEGIWAAISSHVNVK